MARKVFTDGEILYAEDVNTIGKPFVDGQDILGHGDKVDDNSLSDDPEHLKSRFYAWYNRFKVSVSSGLTLSVTQGVISVSGNIISFPPQTINAINNSTSYIWIGKTEVYPTIALRVSVSLPDVCIPLARIISASGVVTSITDLRDVAVDILPPSIPDAVPVGTSIISLLPPTSPVPTGYIELLENPQNISRTTYSALFAEYGTYYGAGDGSTTFTIPGTGQRFLRLGGGSLNPGSVGGDSQITIPNDSIPPHAHNIPSTTHTHGVTDAGHTHNVTQTPHTHGVTDTGHAHFIGGILPYLGNQTFSWDLNSAQTNNDYRNGLTTDINSTGISINSSNANISVNSSGSGVSVQQASTGISSTNNAGNGQAFTHIQPFLVFRVFVKY
ncbi:tail collar protein [Nostoc phage N1]|nr:tail collar protein [Nostoc phage N1]